jgi:hypothetical protein
MKERNKVKERPLTFPSRRHRKLASSLLMRNVNGMNRGDKTLRNVQNDLQFRAGRDRLTSQHLRSERSNGMNGIDPSHLQCPELYINHKG